MERTGFFESFLGSTCKSYPTQLVEGFLGFGVERIRAEDDVELGIRFFNLFAFLQDHSNFKMRIGVVEVDANRFAHFTQAVFDHVGIIE